MRESSFNKFVITSLFLLSFGWANTLIGQNVFFEEADAFFKKNVKNGLLDYEAILGSPDQLNNLVNQLREFDLSDKNAAYSKAFWINAYNILTIQKITSHYPTSSPLKINSFFENKNIRVAGQQLSLNQLEKEKLFSIYKDARIHLLLVCAAVGCPKLKKGAFFPEDLDEQIDKRAKVVLNDPGFIKIDLSINSIQLSEIFRWYYNDFENEGGLRSFINRYRKVNLPEDFKIKYYDYNWTLNDIKNDNIIPFRASDLLSPGIIEIKVFNSLYTQTSKDGFETANSRSSYFSSFTQVLYGWNNRINLGFDLVYKSNVVNDYPDASPFRALAFEKAWNYHIFDCHGGEHNISPLSTCYRDFTPTISDTLRNAGGTALQTHQSIGLSHFGPKIKINPIKKWANISLQQTLFIPINKSVDGSMVFFTQLFYDKPIGNKSQLFVEASLWTVITPDFRPDRFVKVFYSYFPTKKWTVYAMTSNLLEYGAGTKFFIHPNVELEFLYTYYLPLEKYMQDRRAMTFNIGMRYQGG
ncbi:MAG: hypothetical protein ACI8P3_003877 [Saprospiraceae bacterium]|jgi:hypothetical protein